MTKDTFYEYWTGKDVNYTQLWENFNAGKDGYINKFKSMEVSLVQIQFDFPDASSPLFNLEVIYKTFQGLYYDFKNACLNEDEMNSAGPLFVYSIERQCSIFEFLIDTTQVAYFLTALYWGYLSCTEKNETIKSQKIKNFKDQIDIAYELKMDPNKFALALDFINDAPNGLKKTLINLYIQQQMN